MNFKNYQAYQEIRKKYIQELNPKKTDNQHIKAKQLTKKLTPKK